MIHSTQSPEDTYLADMTLLVKSTRLSQHPSFKQQLGLVWQDTCIASFCRNKTPVLAKSGRPLRYITCTCELDHPVS